MRTEYMLDTEGRKVPRLVPESEADRRELAQMQDAAEGGIDGREDSATDDDNYTNGETLWRFSDGTAAYLGGRIEGASPFADALRAALAASPHVMLGPHMLEAVALDTADPEMLDRWLWLRCEAWPRRRGLTMTERPAGLPPLPPESDEPPGTVY